MKPYYDEDGITIYHGDCREVMPLLEQVDQVITDPPYNVSVRGGRTKTTIGKVKRRDGTYRDIVREFGEWDFSFEPAPFLVETVRLLRAGGSLLAFTSEFLIADYLNSGLDHCCLVYWNKRNPAPNFRRLYVRSVEMLVWQTKGGGWVFNGGGYVLNRFDCPILSGYRAQNIESRRHPTQKPRELMRWLVETHSDPNELILDPFMGSGTTLVAAAMSGRRAIGVDVAEQYCEIAAERPRVLPADINRAEPDLGG